MATNAVDEFRRGLTDHQLAVVDVLRAIIMSASGDLTERIKWNAPSFAINGTDKITLGLVRKEGVRLVLHRGAKPRDVVDLQLHDPSGLIRWVAPDRGTAVFTSAREVEAHRPVLRDLCEQWLAATSNDQD